MQLYYIHELLFTYPLHMSIPLELHLTGISHRLRVLVVYESNRTTTGAKEQINRKMRTVYL